MKLERAAWAFAATVLLLMVFRGALSIYHDGFMPDWIWNPWH